MASLYITEYANLAQSGSVNAPMQFPLAAPASPSIADQKLAIGVTSVQSAAFNKSTSFIMVNCDTACSIAISADPTAAATAHRMGANETRFYGVPVGRDYKLAVITNT